ncbi:hypothetical protein MK280_05355 [Myxococcota bacterium]|nr:hypothetical protein [Myxococcota bacterium]
MHHLSASIRKIKISGSSRPRLSRFGRAMGIWIVIHLFSVPVLAEDLLGEPGQASSAAPDSLTVESQSLDALSASSQDPDSLLVGSRQLPSGVDAQSPTPLSQTGVSPDELTATSERLSDLPQATQVQREVDAKISRQVHASQPEWITPQTLAEAQSGLERARARARAADAAVGKMVRRDYPTGEARVMLYDEQKAARAQVVKAERSVLDWGGSVSHGGTP